MTFQPECTVPGLHIYGNRLSSGADPKFGLLRLKLSGKATGQAKISTLRPRQIRVDGICGESISFCRFRNTLSSQVGLPRWRPSRAEVAISRHISLMNI
jgi:hypothetical protein